MEKLSPTEHYEAGRGHLAEAERALKMSGPGSIAVTALSSLAAAHFAASHAATMGVLVSSEVGDLREVDGVAEKIGNDWGTALGIFAPVADDEDEPAVQG